MILLFNTCHPKVANKLPCSALEGVVKNYRVGWVCSKWASPLLSERLQSPLYSDFLLWDLWSRLSPSWIAVICLISLF